MKVLAINGSAGRDGNTDMPKKQQRSNKGVIVTEMNIIKGLQDGKESF